MTSYTVTSQNITIPYLGSYTANVVNVPSRFSKTPKNYSYLPRIVFQGGKNHRCQFTEDPTLCMFPFHKAEAMCNVIPNCIGYGYTSNTSFESKHNNMSELSFFGAMEQPNSGWYTYKVS